MASFDARKRAVLEALASDARDKSRAGGVDAPIADLVARVNLHPHFFTTSSCSGRISVFSETALASEAVDACDGAVLDGARTIDSKINNKKKKKGGDWVFVSHTAALENEVVERVQQYCKTMEDGLLVFRYEPFILALECRTPTAAQLLVTCALSAGFRESGITGMGKRNIVGVRCSIRLEVPMAQAGRLLVPEHYLRFLTALANQKMELNRQRTHVFLTQFVDQVEGSVPPGLPIELNGEPSLIDETFGPSEIGSATHGDLQAGDKVAGDKESKRKLSALKGRQLRALARVQALEDRLRLEAGAACGAACAMGPITMRGHDKAAGSVQDLQRSSAVLSVSGQNCLQGTEMDFAAANGGAKSDGCSVPAAHLTVHGEPAERLQCWSHSAVLVASGGGRPPSVLIYGGFGGPGPRARQGTPLLLDPLTGDLKLLEAAPRRPPRMAHAAVLVGDKMVVIGGRRDPSTVLGDVCVFDVKANTWSFPEVTGCRFLPRHRHAAATVGDKVFVFGGIGCEDTILGDLCMLDTRSWEWTLIDGGGAPCPRHSHALAAVGRKLYLFGGRDARGPFGDLHEFCLETRTWAWVAKGLGEGLSAPRFSHSMTAVGKWLVVLGGCPIAKHGTDPVLFDVQRSSGRRVHLVCAPADALLVRHTATLVGAARLVVIGGGAACFAFGAKFNAPISVDLDSVLEDGSVGRMRRAPITDQSAWTGSPKQDEVHDEASTWVLKLERNGAKAAKDALKQLGWLDQTRKPLVLNQGSHVAFPLTERAAVSLQETRGPNQPSPQEALLRRVVASGGEVAAGMRMPRGASRPVAPLSALETAVEKLLRAAGLPAALLDELPKRWERLGDMAVLPAGSLRSKSWSSMGPALWTTVASALRVHRIARQAPVAATKTRDSKLQVLWGEGGWVEHRENGILYCFDATLCMFSSGNVSEKLRMAAAGCAGEIVVDLFAGIGYYVLPFLVKAGAHKVYACEWNPNAVVALRHNLRVNEVEGRCVVLEGDNRVTAPQGVADRVCLGLLPSSEGSWNVALKALRPEGGMLHVHENVKDTSEAQWLDYLVATLQSLSAALERRWEIRVVHVERVKWYAPHIRHLVADVKCSQGHG